MLPHFPRSFEVADSDRGGIETIGCRVEQKCSNSRRMQLCTASINVRNLPLGRVARKHYN